MKRLLVFIIALILALGMTSCVNTPGKTETASPTGASGETETPLPVSDETPTDTETPANTPETTDTPPETTDTPTVTPTPTGINPDAYKTYKDAFEKTVSAAEAIMKEKIVMSIKMGDFELSTDTGADVSFSGAGTDDLKIRIIVTGEMLGQDLSSDTYYENGYSYHTSGEEKYKVIAEDDGFSVKDILGIPEFEDGSYDSASLLEENGVKTVKFVFSGENLMGVLGSDAEGDGTMTIETEIDADGYFKTIKFDVTASEGEDYNNSAVSVEFVKVGSGVTVEAPEGYLDYPEQV